MQTRGIHCSDLTPPWTHLKLEWGARTFLQSTNQLGPEEPLFRLACCLKGTQWARHARSARVSGASPLVKSPHVWKASWSGGERSRGPQSDPWTIVRDYQLGRFNYSRTDSWTLEEPFLTSWTGVCYSRGRWRCVFQRLWATTATQPLPPLKATRGWMHSVDHCFGYNRAASHGAEPFGSQLGTLNGLISSFLMSVCQDLFLLFICMF